MKLLLRFRRLVTRCREEISLRAWLLLLPAVLLLAMAAAAAFLAWEGFTLLNRDDLATSETAAAIQGLAAALSLAVTVCLVGVTAWYAYLVSTQVRRAGPDVSMKWYLAWADPSGVSTLALNAAITDLNNGPMSPYHKEWYFAIDLTNSGSQAVSVVQISLTCGNAILYRYSGSAYSKPCPLELLPHSTLTVFLEPEDVRRLIEGCKHLKKSEPRRLQTHVGLSSSRTLNSKKVPLRHFIVESSQ